MKSTTIVLVASLLIITGCAHTPITGIALETALRDARKAGWVKVGEKWIPPEVELPRTDAPADVTARLAIEMAMRDLAHRYGRDDWELAIRFRPHLIRLAQLADGALITAAAAAATYGLRELTDGGDIYHQTYNVRADRGSIVQINAGDNNSPRTSQQLHSETAITGGP